MTPEERQFLSVQEQIMLGCAREFWDVRSDKAAFGKPLRRGAHLIETWGQWFAVKYSITMENFRRVVDEKRKAWQAAHEPAVEVQASVPAAD